MALRGLGVKQKVEQTPDSTPAEITYCQPVAVYIPMSLMTSYSVISAPECLVNGRFAVVIEALCNAVAGRISSGVISAALIVLIWRRLRRINGQVMALIGRIQAGRIRAGTLRFGPVAPEDVVPGDVVPRTWVRPPGLPLPRRFGWLLLVVPETAANLASQMRGVLADPAFGLLLAATPRMGKLLQPLCWMLGIEVSVLAPGAGVATVARDVDEAIVTVPAVVPHYTASVGLFGLLPDGRLPAGDWVVKPDFPG